MSHGHYRWDYGCIRMAETGVFSGMGMLALFLTLGVALLAIMLFA